MLIGLHGAGGSGKDTVADYLVKQYGFKRVAFADKLKELALELNPYFATLYSDLKSLVEDNGWDIAKESSYRMLQGAPWEYPVREYLQTLGVSMREVFGPDFWVDQVSEDVDGHWLEDYANVVITDVRFPNELQFINESLGQTWVITGRQRQSVIGSSHASEQRLEGITLGISNTGGFDWLYEQVDYAWKFGRINV